MLSIEMAIFIVLKVLHHLFRSSLDPFGRLSSRALIPTQYTEVLSLGLDDSTGVVVGKRFFGVFGPGFWSCGIAIAERPRIGRYRRADDENLGFSGLQRAAAAAIGRGREEDWTKE